MLDMGKNVTVIIPDEVKVFSNVKVRSLLLHLPMVLVRSNQCTNPITII